MKKKQQVYQQIKFLFSVLIIAIIILLLCYLPKRKESDMKYITNGIYYIHGISSDCGSIVTSKNGLIYEITDPPELIDGGNVTLIIDSNDTKRLEDDIVIYIKERKSFKNEFKIN